MRGLRLGGGSESSDSSDLSRERVSLARWALSAGRIRARWGTGGSETEGVPSVYAGAAAGGGGKGGCLFHFFRDVAEAVIRRVVGGWGRSGAAGGGER